LVQRAGPLSDSKTGFRCHCLTAQRPGRHLGCRRSNRERVIDSSTHIGRAQRQHKRAHASILAEDIPNPAKLRPTSCCHVCLRNHQCTTVY
ncbi:hypothetical protein CTA2_7010, partial [Colletotrichum tanaceti]